MEVKQRFVRIFAEAARSFFVIPYYVAKGTPISICLFSIFRPACFSVRIDNRTVDEDSDVLRLYSDELDHRPVLKPEIARWKINWQNTSLSEVPKCTGRL